MAGGRGSDLWENRYKRRRSSSELGDLILSVTGSGGYYPSADNILSSRDRDVEVGELPAPGYGLTPPTEDVPTSMRADMPPVPGVRPERTTYRDGSGTPQDVIDYLTSGRRQEPMPQMSPSSDSRGWGSPAIADLMAPRGEAPASHAFGPVADSSRDTIQGRRPSGPTPMPQDVIDYLTSGRNQSTPPNLRESMRGNTPSLTDLISGLSGPSGPSAPPSFGGPGDPMQRQSDRPGANPMPSFADSPSLPPLHANMVERIVRDFGGPEGVPPGGQAYIDAILAAKNIQEATGYYNQYLEAKSANSFARGGRVRGFKAGGGVRSGGSPGSTARGGQGAPSARSSSVSHDYTARGGIGAPGYAQDQGYSGVGGAVIDHAPGILGMGLRGLRGLGVFGRAGDPHNHAKGIGRDNSPDHGGRDMRNDYPGGLANNAPGGAAYGGDQYGQPAAPAPAPIALPGYGSVDFDAILSRLLSRGQSAPVSPESLTDRQRTRVPQGAPTFPVGQGGQLPQGAPTGYGNTVPGESIWEYLARSGS